LPSDAADGRAATAEIGEAGERLAATFLWCEGMKILYRNYRAPKGGEVDIVARDRDTLVFCEVKTRTSTAFGRPAEAVGVEKQALVARGALSWLRLLGMPDIRFRFDVVEVVLEEGEKPSINRIEEAFALPEPIRYA
jgi:putative endonuclease